MFVCEFLDLYVTGQIKDLLKSFSKQRKIRISCKFKRKNLNRRYFHEHSFFNVVICVISTYQNLFQASNRTTSYLTQSLYSNEQPKWLLSNEMEISNRATKQSPPLNHGTPISSIYMNNVVPTDNILLKHYSSQSVNFV
jgi:hypothetical protein